MGRENGREMGRENGGEMGRERMERRKEGEDRRDPCTKNWQHRVFCFLNSIFSCYTVA